VSLILYQYRKFRPWSKQAVSVAREKAKAQTTVKLLELNRKLARQVTLVSFRFDEVTSLKFT
jgi:hypothetical protein